MRPIPCAILYNKLCLPFIRYIFIHIRTGVIFFMATDNQTKQSKPAGKVGQRLQHFFTQRHVAFYRLTNGKVGGGKSLLILTTTGRKSGVERDTPLFFFPDGDHFIIIAYNGGAPKHPTWWLNLQSNPKSKIQIRSRVLSVTSRQADPEEH